MEISVIVVAVISLGGPLFLYFQNRQNNKRIQANDLNVIALEKEKLDGAVLDRAKMLYEGMIHQLEAQAIKLREAIERLEREIDEEREDNYKLRQRIRELENQADTLEDEVSQLKVQLTRLENS